MKFLLPFLFVLFLSVPNSNLTAQEKSKLQKVHRYCYVIETKEWYKNQAELWKMEIEKDKMNEDAWYSYYFANRYATMGSDWKKRKELLKSIVKECRTALPESYLPHYLIYYNDDRKLEHLEAAYKINPDKTDLYWEFIQYYETAGNTEKMNEFCQKLYKSDDIISSLYDYSMNVFSSLEENAIVFTNGDNDTYPMWILQGAKNIRKDVSVVNAHALQFLRDYMKIKFERTGIKIDFEKLPNDDVPLSSFIKETVIQIEKNNPEVPIYFVPTMSYDSIREIEKDLHITGLAFKYSTNEFDNSKKLKENIEAKFRIDYMEEDWLNEFHISKSIIQRLNLNYITGFMELSKLYDKEGNILKSEYWKNKSASLAEKAGETELEEKIRTENF